MNAVGMPGAETPALRGTMITVALLRRRSAFLSVSGKFHAQDSRYSRDSGSEEEQEQETHDGVFDTDRLERLDLLHLERDNGRKNGLMIPTRVYSAAGQ